MHTTSDLPDLLAGPLVRRVEPERVLLWLVASRPLQQLHASLQPVGQAAQQLGLSDVRVIPIGRHAYVHLLTITPTSPLPQDQIIHYDLQWDSEQGNGLRSTAAHLCHGDELPSLMIASDNRRLLHGSCRKPHFAGEDALVRTDSWLAERRDQPEQRPAWLLMTGDQVYVDDVSGPLLVAVHQLIARLGLFDEALEGATVADSGLATAPQPRRSAARPARAAAAPRSRQRPVLAEEGHTRPRWPRRRKSPPSAAAPSSASSSSSS